MAKELLHSGPDAFAVPAAQYIRMSTEHQRYSPDSQRAAIAAFAAYRGFQIVQTYQDAGKSGLTFNGRPALKALLADGAGRSAGISSDSGAGREPVGPVSRSLESAEASK